MMTRKTDTKTLINAMRILARDIQSDDGVANGAISEAADRMEELQAQHRKDDDAYAKLWQMYGDLEDERDRLKASLKWAVLACDAIDATHDDDASTAAMFREALHDIRYEARTALKEDRDELL